MSNYTSENTKVLATHMQGDNERMLLLHERGDGTPEYIIGSYFKAVAPLPNGEVHEDGSVSGEHPGFTTEAAFGRFWEKAVKEYSWDWGHYFNDFERAMSYWWREVTGPQYDENTCPHCGAGGGLILEEADDFEAPRIYLFRCEDCGGLSQQVWSLTENVPVEG